MTTRAQDSTEDERPLEACGWSSHSEHYKGQVLLHWQVWLFAATVAKNPHPPGRQSLAVSLAVVSIH